MANSKQGFLAPFVRVFYKDEELSVKQTDFRYVYNEEEDDECKFTIIENRPDAVDKPQYQVNAEIKITWGFIGGTISEVRKVYVQEVLPKFGGGNIVQISITASEKAVSLKQEGSRAVHSNVTLLDLAKKIADKHDLKAYLEIPENIDPYNNSDAQVVMNVLGRAAGSFYLSILKIKGNAPDSKGLTYYPGNTPNQRYDIGAIQNKQFFKRDSQKISSDTTYETLYPKGKVPLLPFFNSNYNNVFNGSNEGYIKYNSIPQAGRSDLQMLRDVAKRDANNLIVDTRDDAIIIKKRNFNQPPYKSFEYLGPEGELLEFTPQSKQRARKAASNNVSFGYWDRANKQYMTGDANAENSPEVTALAKFVYFQKQLRDLPQDAIFSYKFDGAPTNLGGSPYKNPGTSFADNTQVQIQPHAIRPVTVKEANQTLDELLKAYGKPMDVNTANNPADAFNQASNLRDNNALKMNPATARFQLDPNIKVGILLTILNVGKKYSGNYYVIKASHVIDAKGYAYTEVELATNGANIKANDKYLPSTRTSVVNSTIGPRKTQKPTKTIKLNK